MIDIDFVAAILREGEALADAAESGMSYPIAVYPRWTVSDMVAHTGSVHRWVEQMVATPVLEPPDRLRQEERDPRRLVTWFREGLVMLVGTLGRSDGTRPVWTMAEDQTVAFWRRRMAHETVMHRWDVEDSVGDPTDIDVRLAATGIPESLEIHLERPLAGTHIGGAGERIGLRCTDVEGAWTVILRGQGVTIEDGSERSDATLAGRAGDLWLTIAQRRGAGIEITGDQRAVAAFRRTLQMVPPPSH